MLGQLSYAASGLDEVVLFREIIFTEKPILYILAMSHSPVETLYNPGELLFIDYIAFGKREPDSESIKVTSIRA